MNESPILSASSKMNVCSTRFARIREFVRAEIHPFGLVDRPLIQLLICILGLQEIVRGRFRYNILFLRSVVRHQDSDVRVGRLDPRVDGGFLIQRLRGLELPLLGNRCLASDVPKLKGGRHSRPTTRHISGELPLSNP